MSGLFGLSYSMFTECWQTTRRGTMGGLIQSMYFVGEITTEGDAAGQAVAQFFGTRSPPGR
jgi:hypothetical protein